MNDEDGAGDIDDSEVVNDSDDAQVVFLPTMVGQERGW